MPVAAAVAVAVVGGVELCGQVQVLVLVLGMRCEMMAAPRKESCRSRTWLARVDGHFAEAGQTPMAGMVVGQELGS